jgi:alkylated DNA repair dioxygenase AlkB
MCGRLRVLARGQAVTAGAPSGFLYVPDFIGSREETVLLVEVRALEYARVEMRGQVARRRVAHFGWRYGYASWRIEPGPPIPEAFVPLRARAAALVAVPAEALAEVLVTEYPPGAAIGWHQDAPQFGPVVGVSLLGACRMRFRRDAGEVRESRAVELAPRSAYVIAGEARWAWQHAIPAIRGTRYSITFRTLRETLSAREADARAGTARTGPRSGRPR